MVLKWIGKVLGDSEAGSVNLPATWKKNVGDWLSSIDKASSKGGLRNGLADDLRSFLHTGEPMTVLHEVAQSSAVAESLGLLSMHGWPTTIARSGLYEQFDQVPVDVAARWVKVLSASVGNQQVQGYLHGAAPRWPELLVMHSAGASFNVYTAREEAPTVTASAIEAMLEFDGQERSAWITSAFVTSVSSGYGMDRRLRMVRTVKGYAQALERHVEALRPLMQPTTVDQRLHVLALIEPATSATLAHLVRELCEHAVAASKQVRAVAEPLVRKCGDVAFDSLKDFALNGKPEQRIQALRLVAQLGRERDLKAWLDFARGTAGADKAPSIQALVSEWDAQTAVPDTAQAHGYAYEVPSIDWSPASSAIDAGLLEAFWRELDALTDKENELERIQHKQLHAAGQTQVGLYLSPRLSDGDRAALQRYLGSADVQPPKRKTDRHHKLDNLVARGLEQLAGTGKLTPVAALKMVLFFQLEKKHHDMFSSEFCKIFEVLHAKTAHPTLLELSTMVEAAGRDGRALLLNYCSRWGGAIANTWPDEHVWPFVAHHERDIIQSLSNSTASDYWFDREGLYRAIRTLPVPPLTIVNALFDVALGSAKSERLPAQNALHNLPGKEARIISALADGKSESRSIAAQWLQRLRHLPAIPALEQAVAKEKHDVAKGAMLDALQAMGQPVEKYLDRDALAKEAAKALPKGVPKDVEWFPWSAMPEVRWQDNSRSVPADVLKLLLVQAVKQKAPEPNAVLRKYCSMFEPRDREAFGQFVLETWLREDTRPISPDEAANRARTNAQQTLHFITQYPQYAKDNPHVGRTVEELTSIFLPAFMKQPAGSAIASKGLLAVAAACAAERAAPPVQRYLKEYYGTRAAHGKALIAMLAWVDHPSATQLMLAVGSRFRTKSFQEEATRQASALADRRGWTLAELADRTIPSAGFDETGVLELSFGARVFTAKLLPDFKIELFNPDGKKIASLPEPRQDDDAELARDAKKAFTAAKKEIKSIVDLQSDRLYEALCTERDWPAADWKAYLQQHPVVRHLVHRLVWLQLDTDGRLVGSFRPMDDGTLTDTDDSEVQLADDARVRLAHDSLLTPESVKSWLKHMADYEVKPLFQQLGKGVYTLPADQANSTEIKDFEGHVLEAFALRGRALKLGYTRGPAEDGGWFHVYGKRFPTMGLEAIIEFTGNSLPEENRTVSLLNLSFANTGQQQSWQRTSQPLSKVPKVLVSECYNDLRLMAGEGGGLDPEWRTKTQY